MILRKEQMESIVWIVNNQNDFDVEKSKVHYNTVLDCDDVSYLDGDYFLDELLKKIMIFYVYQKKNMSLETLNNIKDYIRENI